ncbi:MAG: FHA domain-containing protein [Pirellulales bacterium]
MELRFLFKSSSGKPRVHTKRLPVVVGRSDAEDVKLRIPTDSVSRRHCEFFLDEAGSVCLRDLGSTNGTTVNGTKLDATAVVPIRSGSVVKLGTVGFRVEFQKTSSQGDHDSDTIPIENAELPPRPDMIAPTEPMPPASEEQDFEELAAAEADPADGATGSDFAFLGEATAADEPPAWPTADEPPAADDEKLGDFFKGFS